MSFNIHFSFKLLLQYTMSITNLLQCIQQLILTRCCGHILVTDFFCLVHMFISGFLWGVPIYSSTKKDARSVPSIFAHSSSSAQIQGFTWTDTLSFVTPLLLYQVLKLCSFFSLLSDQTTNCMLEGVVGNSVVSIAWADYLELWQ